MVCELKNCENDHVQLNGECVMRNSPKGRIALRSLQAGEHKIKKEQSFPAYADEAVRESIKNLTERVKEMGSSMEILEKAAAEVKILQVQTNEIVDRVNEVGSSLKEVEEVRKSNEKIIERVNEVDHTVELMENSIKKPSAEIATMREELSKAFSQIHELSEKLKTEELASKTELKLLYSSMSETTKAVELSKNLADKSAKDVEDVRTMASEIAENFKRFQEDLKKADVVASSADGLKLIEEAAEKAADYVKSLVEDSEKVVVQNLSEVQAAVAQLSEETVKSADALEQAKKDMEETAVNASNALQQNTENFAQALQDLTLKSAEALNQVEIQEQTKLVESAQAARDTVSKDLLRQAAAIQSSLAVSGDIAVRGEVPMQDVPLPATQREEIRTSTNLLQTSQQLGLEELQAASDMNAALDLQSKLNSAKQDYNQAVAKARAINEQISDMQKKNTNNPTEQGLNWLAQAQAASDRQSAVIESARSQVANLQSQYDKLSTLASSEKQIVDKHRAQFDAERVQAEVSRQKEVQRKAEDLRNPEDYDSKMKQESLKAAMQYLMRKGIKYGTPKYSGIMGPIKVTLARGEKINYDELDVVIESSL